MSTLRFSNKAELDRFLAGEKPRSTSKYGNKKTSVDGITFDSAKEAAKYCELKILKKSGKVKWFTMQVPFYLPALPKAVIYRADFLIVYADDRIEIHDSKGARTREYLNKKKMVRYNYGIEVIES